MSMIGNLVALSAAQLQTFVADPSLLEHFLYPNDGDAEPANHIDLDKAWHAIHFVLNGEAWEGQEPLFLTILGGEEIGDDMGYGPARYLVPGQVAEVATALSAITPDEFASRFDSAALTAAEIYPEIWDEGAESLEYVRSFYDETRRFYEAASSRSDAVLIYLN